MVPFYVNVARGEQFVIGNHDYTYSAQAVTVDFEAVDKKGRIEFSNPLQPQHRVSLESEGLKAVTIYLSSQHSHFIANYDSEGKNAMRCCVHCGNFSYYGSQVCVDNCNGSDTVCCG